MVSVFRRYMVSEATAIAEEGRLEVRCNGD